MHRRAVVIIVSLVAGCASSEQGPPPPLPPSGPRLGVFISPMGEPFRAAAGDGDLVDRWFAGADADHDGALSRAELEADAGRFFRTLDSDGDGQLAPSEIVRYETEVAPEISLGAQMDRRRPGARRRGADKRPASRLPEGASRYGLLDLPEPVIAADGDFDRAVSAAEFRAAAAERFAALDRDRDGRLTRAELEPLPPAPAKR